MSDNCQRAALGPLANKFRSGFSAAVVCDDYFKARAIFLLDQGPQALIKWRPIVIDGYDDAE